MSSLATTAEISARTCLGVVFLVSATAKVRRRHAFAEFRESVRTLAPWSARHRTAVGAAVVTAEFAIALAMAAHRTTPVGLTAAAGLLTAFTAALVAARRRGDRRPCRCFGASAEPPGRRHVARNLCLIALAVAGLAAGPAADPVTGPVVLLAVFAGAAAGAVVTLLDDLADVFGARPSPEESR